MRGRSLGTPKRVLVVLDQSNSWVRKIEIPDTDAGSLDSQPKTLVSNGIFGRWMYDRGHVSPSVLR